MITSVQAWADYYEGIRKRTLKYIEQIPADQMGFTPHDGKFTLGELVLHLASTEAMFAGVLTDGEWRYPGHDSTRGATKEEAVAYLHRAHQAAVTRIREAGDEVLAVKRPTLKGYPVSGWHLLMALAEHEVHHRAQIGQYLTALGLQPPQIFGLKIEDVPREAQ